MPRAGQASFVSTWRAPASCTPTGARTGPLMWMAANRGHHGPTLASPSMATQVKCGPSLQAQPVAVWLWCQDLYADRRVRSRHWQGNGPRHDLSANVLAVPRSVKGALIGYYLKLNEFILKSA